MRLLLKHYSIHKMCPSTCMQLFLKTEIFSVLAFCPHVNGVAGTINTVFQKRSPEWSFASIILDSSFNCGRTKNGGFRIRWCHSSYSTCITHSRSGMFSYLHRFSVFICFLFCFLSNIFNQRNSIHRFFDLAILCGETIGHNVMFSAVSVDPFVFRKWWNQ